MSTDNLSTDLTLLDAFRMHYFRLDGILGEALRNPTDTTVLERIGDDLLEYSSLVREHVGIFDPAEFEQLQNNLTLMLSDVRNRHAQSLEESHHGHPIVVARHHNGRRGRPQIVFDPNFLAWAYNRRSISALARFLGVGRTTLRNALIEHGLIPQLSPPSDLNNSFSEPLFPQSQSQQRVQLQEIESVLGTESDDILEPNLDIPMAFPEDVSNISHIPTSPLNRYSEISDEDLDNLVIRLRLHYRRAGIGMIDGMLLRLGHRVQRERIRTALLRIDPVRRVFERIRIRRRTYKVAGPNSLWHHDGQHGGSFVVAGRTIQINFMFGGLIRWGVIIHGFIDGYSRLITGLKASNNNYGNTVLDVFLHATAQYGIPSRLRGDHGTENILVAAWMEERNGRYRGSYIWGRSVHNVRIERLWVDVTAQVGSTWADLFSLLELQHGLDINNANHIWLLQFLFLSTINQDLAFFAEAWNEHRIQIRDGPNRSPIDMFNFDMLVHGVRGTDLTEVMSPEELEVYGIDWEGLRDDRILHSQRLNNDIAEGDSSWLGQAGPPARLSDVRVDSPDMPFDDEMCHLLRETVQPWLGRADDESVVFAWAHALAYVRQFDAGF